MSNMSNLNDTSSDVHRHGFDEAASTAFLIHVFDENDVQVKLPSILPLNQNARPVGKLHHPRVISLQ